MQLVDKGTVTDTGVIETLLLELDLPCTKPVSIAAIYRPPHATADDLYKLLFYLSDFLQTNRELIILGDFNIDLLLDDKYLQFLNVDFSLNQLIETPTCVTSSSATLIDHI